MDTWYNDPLVLFNEDPHYGRRNPQGYVTEGYMRKDGREAQLPEMPWKKQPQHKWEYSTLRFGGGEAYRVECSECGEGKTKVYLDEDTEVREWPQPPDTYCDPTLRNEGYTFEGG